MGPGPNPASRDVNGNFFFLKKGERSELLSSARKALGTPLFVVLQCHTPLLAQGGHGPRVGSHSPPRLACSRARRTGACSWDSVSSGIGVPISLL